MIVVTGSATVQRDNLDEARRLSLEHVRRSREEPGCISHAVHIDCENPCRLVFIEQWEDPNFSFNGASGNVRFGADESYRYYVYGAHDRVDLFDIESFADGGFEPIGSWDPLSEIEEEIVSLTVDP